MSTENALHKGSTNAELESMVAEVDTGNRIPKAFYAAVILMVVPLAWSLFQLWTGSPLPSQFGIGFLNDTQSRAIHLAFALFLTYLAFPAFKGSPRSHIPITDWLLAFGSAFCAAYIYIFYEDLSLRPGLPTTMDLVVSGIGITLVLEAARRSLGPPLMIVALVFLAYIFFGNSPYLPDILQWRGASFSKTMSHMWLSTEGVFGIALGVSSGFVFLFVLFGALLNSAGAGEYFIKVAFSLLGHMRGGPAKAAVLSSAMTGMISGSSIANTVTTGTFTIPLMKRVGFSAEKAGAIEVSSSVNGVIMPPVMGAVAFLMVEYVGIPYIEVVKHAFLPATISYIALLYIVHLEALKMNMQGLPRTSPVQPIKARLLRSGIVISSMLMLLGAVYFIVEGIKEYFSLLSAPLVIALILGIYVFLVRLSASEPDLDKDDPDQEMVVLPEFSKVYKTGLYYLVPLFVLVWFLMIERNSPGLSAFWASLLMAFVLLTQKPLKAFFRKSPDIKKNFGAGLYDLYDGLTVGARNMIGIGVATATAGIIVGTVTITGIGGVMSELVELVSGGSLMIMLLFVALLSIILGMGLPTTANYIVVSSLMANVVVDVGAQHGLIVPLVAIHMFVFYFGIMADVTPPVGLASFAAAAISGGSPLKTGFIAFFYSLRTALLPFLFIFNTDLLLIDVTWWQGIFVFIISLIAMLVFAAVTQGYFFTQNRLWETGVLLLVAFTLFRPDYWQDMVEAPYESINPNQIVNYVSALPDNSLLRMRVEGETLDGKYVKTTVNFNMGAQAEGAQRLFKETGLELATSDDGVTVDNIRFGSIAEQAGMDFDWKISSIEHPVKRFAKEWFFIPALIVLVLVIFVQRRRLGDSAKKVETYV
ncbi:MAG: TRAP transporter permease [Marinomonas sp.]